MATNLPSDPYEIVRTVAVKAPRWTLNQAAIGSSPSQVAAVNAALAEAEAAQHAAGAARQAAESATQQFYRAAQTLRAAASVVVRNAQTLAKAQGDAEVYVLASINVPSVRSRLAPPPAQPQSLSAEIVPTTGAVVLRWQSRNPRGVSNVVYQIRRGLDGEQPETLIGIVGGGRDDSPTEAGPARSGSAGRGGRIRAFRDASVPAGTRVVRYSVTPIRGNQTGPVSAVFSLQIGMGGAVNASGSAMKLAA